LSSAGEWSAFANETLYPFIAGIFQFAQAHNVSLSDDKSVVYHLPSQAIEFDPSLMWDGPPPGSLRSFAFDAIIGADSRDDEGVTMKDVFDVIVNTTQNITPSCE